MNPDGESTGLAPGVSAYANPQHSVGYLLRLAFRAATQALERRTLVHGVSSGQWHFLRELWREDGLTQRELSGRAGTTDPTTVIAVHALVKSGLARREPDAVDRRKTHVRLTQKGRDLEPVLLPLVAEVNARATAGLTEAEVETLRRALRRIAENLAGPAAR